MKMRRWLAWLALGIAACGFARAQEAAAQEPPVPPELKALIEKTRAKLESGARTEAAMADELKAFDALIESHRKEPGDLAAETLWMKAILYLQVFEDLDKGEALVRQVKADFPNSGPAQNVDAVLATIATQKESAKLQAALVPGAVFPDFAEKDLEGQPLSLARFKGKVVLVDFWATWCGPCVAELPNVLAAYQKYHAKGFEIVGISLDENEGALKGFLSAKGMKWPQYFDGQGWESKLGRRYGVSSIPATFLLDRDGKIVAKNLRGPALDAELEKLLKD